MKKINILFIVSSIGKKKDKPYIGTWKMEPLTVAVLKALTPEKLEGYELKTLLQDDRIELIDYETDADIVILSVETYTAKRSYEIAQKFRARGIKVVLGGYHVTLVPEEAQQYADCIIRANAESVWLDMLKDFVHGELKQSYQGTQGTEGTKGREAFSVQADKSIFMGKKYMPLSLVETGRGCCNMCEFCAIAAYYKSHYYPREHEAIVRDIQNSKNKYFFLVDDNMFADKAHALALFEKLKPLKIRWAGQGTLDMAQDVDFLKAMKESGCELILIGFESLDENTLKKMNKRVNIIEEERDELVRRIHKAGIGIYATFVFGYDNDTEETVSKALAFAKKHNFYTAAFNHLLPFPSTKLYKRLAQEKRLLYDAWWLADDYHYGEIAFEPKNMSAARLSLLCQKARKEFASFKTVLKRGFMTMRRTSPLMWGLFWMINIPLGEEIDQKMYVPIGKNLDELPK